MKTTVRISFLAALLFINLVVAPAQIGKKVNEFKSGPSVRASLDRLGNLYLVSANNVIRKYDTDGKFMSEFLNANSVSITGIEPWNPLRVFVYSRAKQRIVILDRFMAQQEELEVDPSLAIEPVLASPLPNNSFWLLDNADQSLKKVDITGTKVLAEITLKLPKGTTSSFVFLREYQNLLFLINPTVGLQIFSNVGKPIRTLTAPGLEYIGFLGEEIYVLEKGVVKFYDLYSEEEHILKVDPAAKFVLITDERLISVKSDKVEVFEYKP